MPRQHNATAGPSQAPGYSPRRYAIDWFSDMEDHLVASLARADSCLFVGTDEFDWRGEGDLSPLPSPLMGPGAGLWDPDLPEVSIDTLSPQDACCAADVLSLPSILAHRKREADIRLATTPEDIHCEALCALQA